MALLHVGTSVMLSMLCCFGCVCDEGATGHSLPRPWSGQLEDCNLKGQTYVPAGQLAQPEMPGNISRRTRPMSDIPRIFRTLAYSIERFCITKLYECTVWLTNVSIQQNRCKLHNLTMSPEKTPVPYAPSHCFVQMEIKRECMYTSMPCLHVYRHFDVTLKPHT